ncbi:MAG: carboxypeptidase regulatory-like domain-containing protein, partial [Planctomycetota bacterium]
AAKIQAHGYRTRSEQSFDLGADERVFELSAWPCVRGVVRTADGSTPGAIEVHLRATDANGAVADARARASGRCDPDGRFALCDLRPGIYVLEASASGWATRRSAPFALALERDAPEQTLVLAIGGAVSARVVALRGALRDAFVEAHSAPPGEAEVLQAELESTGAGGGAGVGVGGGASTTRIASAPVGDDGTARLEHLPDGPVWIVARSRDQLAEVRGPFHLDARESTATVEFELAPGARVRGRVLLGAQPVAGALVILRRPSAPGFGALRAVADERGEFKSPLLPAGTWKLVARRQGGNDGTRSAEATVQVDASADTTIDLELR